MICLMYGLMFAFRHAAYRNAALGMGVDVKCWERCEGLFAV